MGLYYGEPIGYQINYKNDAIEQYVGIDWKIKLMDFVNSSTIDFDTIDTFSLRCPMSSTYDKETSISNYHQYDSLNGGNFKEWWTKNDKRILDG